MYCRCFSVFCIVLSGPTSSHKLSKSTWHAIATMSTKSYHWRQGHWMRMLLKSGHPLALHVSVKTVIKNYFHSTLVTHHYAVSRHSKLWYNHSQHVQVYLAEWPRWTAKWCKSELVLVTGDARVTLQLVSSRYLVAVAGISAINYPMCHCFHTFSSTEVSPVISTIVPTCSSGSLAM